jgi:hypothetical protein
MSLTIMPRRYAPAKSAQSSYLTLFLLAIVAGWTWCAFTRGGRGVRDARIIISQACLQSPCAHDAPHYYVQALSAREKRSVVLPHAFGLLASVAGWTWCAPTGGGRGVRDARMIVKAHHVS